MYGRLKRILHAILHRNVNPTRMVAVSFALIVLSGTVLLMLPFASRDGQVAPLFTCLFTATSATCVTGLVLVDTWTQWTMFGQVVILLMVQLGGLGFMTVITLFSFAFKRRIGLSERLLMVSTFNLNDLDGVVRVVRHALMGAFLLESAGSVILSLCFVPIFGLAEGIWMGVFHAISAFCNAGFDLFGGYTGEFSSLSGFADHPVVLLSIAALVIVGGLGFFVWEDILEHRTWKKLTLYTKMVLVITASLLLFGTVFILGAEYNGSLAGMTAGDKVLNAFFQSTTLRTAGFNVLDQGALTDSTTVLATIFMLIGGSSGSTAGGIKTATLGILILALRSGMRGTAQTTLAGRSVSHRRVINAMTLTLMVYATFSFVAMFISLVDHVPYLDAAFETASALGTVGLTTGITTQLSTLSQVCLMLLMYMGRVGIMSFSIAFLSRSRHPEKIKYPTFNVFIG